MGEVKEFKKSEIAMIESYGKTYIGEVMLDNGAPVIDILHNPCILSMQIMPQQSKLGGVSFTTIINMIVLGVETLNFDSDENSTMIWGIVSDDNWVQQYKETIKQESLLKKVTH